ncbi:MAG: flagellar hook-basal body complex protein FliE [Arcobacteraceae bacterium]|nr:flagellar hook-basal body complex protein FliE [Arcobacteraceae bacterium]
MTLKPESEKIEGNSFSDVLKTAMGDVNTQQVEAYDAMKSIATGKVENLQEAIHQIEEAELSLKLGLEVKNKALGAYKQIMAMQV